MELRPYQAEAVQAVAGEWNGGRRKTLLVLPTGCHALGERLLMHDGTSRAVEDIHEGDRLMGPDGTARAVLAVHEGEDDLYRIVPVKGSPFTVNSEHILSLVSTRLKSEPDYPSEDVAGTITDVSVAEYLGWSGWRRHVNKLYRAPLIERFGGNDGSEATVDPYFLGVLLGDGELKNGLSVTTMDDEIEREIMEQCGKYGMTVRTVSEGRATTFHMRSGRMGRSGGALANQLRALGLKGCGSADKHVPHYYKTLPAAMRAQVVAGLLDTDGSLASRCTYDFVSKSRRLSEDMAFMCRSLGLAAYVSESRKTCQTGYSGTYWRVSISGDCRSVIPCRVPHKKAGERRQAKDVLRTGFAVEHAGRGRYRGFTVDGDNRYLLEDFTVTHNCGKTVVFATVAADVVRDGGRVLVLAHRGELLEQAADKIMSVAGLGCSVEKAERTGEGEWFRITVGSVQTMMRESRLQRFPHDWFDAIIIDEAHHAVSDSYRAVLDWFPCAKVLGVTATPDRGDQRSLGSLFDSIAYQYSMVSAIREGYLCPIRAQTIPIDLDISAVGVSAGDFKAGDVGCALEPYLERIADEMAAACRGRKTVVFLPLVDTSKRFRRLLAERGLDAMEVDGESADRAEVLERFDRAGAGSVLCNSMLLTEGWDCPSVDCVVVLRPTKVRGLYCQMVGRGTRLSPETGKDHLLLLDFLWHTERHELCRPAHLVAESSDVAAAMTDAIAADGGAVDIEDAAAQAEADVIAQREEALARELAACRAKKRKLVDPLQFEMSICAEDLVDYVPTFAWEMAPASDGQLGALEKFGIAADSVECAGKASMLLDRLIKRKEEGLSTAKQIRFLEQRGFRRVGTWSFDDASRMISRISMNGWRIPPGVDPAAFVPGGRTA